MDAVNVNEQSVAFASVVGKTAKINKYVVLGLNFIFFLPYVIRNYSIQGLITFLVTSLLVFLSIFKSSKDVPAVVEIPKILMADTIAYVGIKYFELKAMVNIDSLSLYFSDTPALFWIVFLAGLVVGLVGVSSKKITWITGLAGGLIGASIILVGWSTCDISNFHFFDFGAVLLLVFTSLDILWTIILYFIVKNVPNKTAGAVWAGIFLLCFFLGLLTIETNYVKEYLPVWKTGLLELPNTFFAWWKIILFSVVDLACVFTLYLTDGDKGNHLSVDTYALVVLEEIVITAKILINNYFPLNGLILICLLIGTFRCMKNDYTGRKTLGLNSIDYLPAQFIAASIAIFLFRRGLWINVIISVVFFIIFYTEYNKHQKIGSKTSHWVTIILCLIFETIAFVWTNHFSLDLAVILFMVLVASIFTVLVINLKQPGGRKSPNSLKIIVCACVAVTCLVVATSNSIDVDFIPEDENQNVCICIEPKGKNDSISSAHCYWRDITGKALSEDIDILNSEYTTPIDGEMLTVVVEDSQGFVSSKVFWYPHWLHTILE